MLRRKKKTAQPKTVFLKNKERNRELHVDVHTYNPLTGVQGRGRWIMSFEARKAK